MQMGMPEMMAARPTKKCTKCGGDWDLEACYRRINRTGTTLGALSAMNFHAACIMCELTARNDPTPEERARRKAQSTIVLHAEKYSLAPKEFARRFGWDIERIVYDITHGHENTCPYCYERYDSMGHGLSDITLDVVDPTKEPYYRTNVRWCCQTCNREKAAMPPILWDIRCATWPLWAKRRDAIKEDQTHDLPLFSARQLF